VTQREILEAVWPDTFVNPEVVKKYVLEVRKVLGDRSDHPTFIETLPRRGYQFVAPVSEASSETAISSSVRPVTMVGRDAARTLLERCLDSALHGERQIVFVTGEAGAGKTTPLHAVSRRAAARGGPPIRRGAGVRGL